MKLPYRSMLLFCSALLVITQVQAAKYKEVEGGVSNGGSLSGSIMFDGTPPPAKELNVDTDAEHCGKQYSENLIVGKSGGIKNAVVSVSGIASGKAWQFPANFTFDQHGCVFKPHVMLLKPKTGGEVLNSDPIGHNVHTISKGIFNVNKKMKANTEMQVKKTKLRKPGVIRVKCDLHSWMSAWWYIAESPYTALTDENGNFSIGDIPPGTYQLKIWHEKLGESEQTITIEAGSEAKKNVSLKL